MPLRAIIIDDEINGIKTLQTLIDKYIQGVRIVASTDAAEEGIRLVNDFRPDILFLDVSMPRMSGFEFLEQLTFRGFHLVFTTAHSEYAIKAIKAKAFDYLMKPIDIDDLKQCFDNINALKKQDAPGASAFGIIELSVKSGVIFVRPADIIKIEASGSYTIFYLKGGMKHLVSRNMKEYEAQLDPDRFYRCHNSFIINLGEVNEMANGMEGLYAKMTDGSVAEISRKNKKVFLERLRGIQ